MDSFKVSDLKDWREKLDISQKRLAELASISLTTLRQLEFGIHKPQNRTLKKIFEIMKGVESGAISMEEIKPRRRRRKDAVDSTAASAPAPAPVFVSSQEPEPVRAVATPLATPSRGSVPIQLSNLDLELINRVLNMSAREKLALIEKLM